MTPARRTSPRIRQSERGQHPPDHHRADSRPLVRRRPCATLLALPPWRGLRAFSESRLQRRHSAPCSDKGSHQRQRCSPSRRRGATGPFQSPDSSQEHFTLGSDKVIGANIRQNIFELIPGHLFAAGRARSFLRCRRGRASGLFRSPDSSGGVPPPMIGHRSHQRQRCSLRAANPRAVSHLTSKHPWSSSTVPTQTSSTSVKVRHHAQRGRLGHGHLSQVPGLQSAVSLVSGSRAAEPPGFSYHRCSGRTRTLKRLPPQAQFQIRYDMICSPPFMARTAWSPPSLPSFRALQPSPRKGVSALRSPRAPVTTGTS